jgi:hypothetical protein
MNSTREVASRLVDDWVTKDYNRPNQLHPLIDAIDAALRQREQEVRAEERERAVTRFMAVVKAIKGPNVPRVDLYEAMLAAGREIHRRDDAAQEGEQIK